MKRRYLEIVIPIVVILFLCNSVNATDSSTFGSGNISIKITGVKKEVGDTIKISYGDPLEIEVNYPMSTSGYLDILDRDYYNEIIERFNLLEGSGIKKITLEAEDYKPATNFTIRVILNNGESYISEGKIIMAEFTEPDIQVNLQNFNDVIAKGDVVIVSGTITATEYTWTVFGPYDRSKFYVLAEDVYVGGDAEDVNPGETEQIVTSYDHEVELRVPTQVIIELCGGTAGRYSIKIWNSEYPDTVREIYFTISDVTVDLIIERDEISAGDKLVVNGTTNVAKTDSNFDDTSIGLNKVKIYVYGAEGQLLSSYTVNVDGNGTFSEGVTFSLSWDKDVEYKIVANVTTGNGYFAEDFEFIEVKSPEVRFEMDDLTYTRGEEIRFKGRSTLGAGSTVYIYEDDLDFLSPHSVTTYEGEQYVKALVGADGSWQTDRMRILETALPGQYTVRAVIFSPGTFSKLDEDSIRINIVKNELEVEIDKSVARPGDSIIINGSTTADVIFVFSSDDSVFQDITEKPDEKVYSTESTDMTIRPENGKFSKEIRVIDDADEGYYYIYLYAPPSSERIDTVEDPQKSFLITITSDGAEVNETTTPAPTPETGEESNVSVEKTPETPEIPPVQTVQEVTVSPKPVIAEQTKEVHKEEEEVQKTETERPVQDEMTIPKLRKMLPGFEMIIALECFVAALILRRIF